MKSYNEELSTAFNEMGDLLSLLDDNPFKIRAYYTAARRLKEEIKPITAKTTAEELDNIPGVGKALVEKIFQYIQTGKIKALESLRRKVPKAVRELLGLPHLGPKRVRILFIELGIKTKADLIKKAKSGELEKVKGFGPTLVAGILEGIEKGQEKKHRHERKDVKPIAEKLLKSIRSVSGVKLAEAAGSYRRLAPTVGDLDILVCGNPKIDVLEKKVLEPFPNHTILASGETKVAFVLFPQNLQVDIRILPEESYGAALLYFTGSKEFNVMMRKVAIDKGYLLNEYGLFKDGEFIAGATEEEVFDKLGLPHTVPERRK